MAKYINDTSCPECDDYIRPYGCINASCPIRIDYNEGREEMAADFEHDKRRDKRLEE